MSVYEELEALVLPRLTNHQADLTTHDREAIAAHSGPFLHWSWDCGTYLISLVPPDEYPRKDVWIPYLFGQADRWHLVKQVTEMASYFLNPTNNPERYMALYFDGKRIRKIDCKRALEIARDYRRATEDAFDGRQMAAAS
jgi:hypothetical protein